MGTSSTCMSGSSTTSNSSSCSEDDGNNTTSMADNDDDDDDDDDDGDDDDDEDDDDDDDDDNEIVNDDDDDDDDEIDDENDRPRRNRQKNIELPTLCVILTGQFTNRQFALTQKRTKISLGKIKKALKWLRKFNIMYEDIEIDDDDVIVPYVIDCHKIENSSGSNVETVFEINAIFPNSTDILPINGGYKTTEEFKRITLDKMMMEKSQREEVLLARSSSTILRDYVDNNLMKTFPLQFPYGCGNLNLDGENRTGTSYLQYLLSLSHPNFHTPEFAVILHNIWERRRMVTSSFLKVTDNQKSSIGQVGNDDIHNAIERFLSNRKGSEPADLFLKKLSAVTGSMATSVQASNRARQDMFSMMTKYGLPAVLFTITPDDLYNFRIKIMSTRSDNGCPEPPLPESNEEVLKEFVLNSANTRVAFPSLCAFDFENVIAITIEHFLGWDEKKRRNIHNKGLFGNLDCFAYAVEEQGRKTLHAHFLLWINNWDKILDGLGDPSKRENVAKVLKEYTSSIMTSRLHSNRQLNCRCGNSLYNSIKCSTQDLRNLRTQECQTSIGGRNIVKCLNCDVGYTSDGLARLAVDEQLMLSRIQNDDEQDDLFDSEELWFKNSVKSKRQVMMELKVIHEVLKQQKEHYIPDQLSDRYKNTDFIITALKNLHSSEHSRNCFKKDYECRMQLPKNECFLDKIVFEEEPKAWYTWKGIKKERQLFVYESRRVHEDCFVNTSNESASSAFGCNTNIIAAVDGGSVMYITMYLSKDTQKEDRKLYGDAARIMVKKLNEKALEIALNDNLDRDEQDHTLAGLRALIGASFIATGSHICSATMASYLTRNHSRFQFSHGFSSAYISDFHKKEVEDFTVDSNEKGVPFVKSQVLNYLLRPTALSDFLLPFFFLQYI